MTIPEAMTIRQNPKPSDSWLVASLLRFPSVLTPITSMELPRATNP